MGEIFDLYNSLMKWNYEGPKTALFNKFTLVDTHRHDIIINLFMFFTKILVLEGATSDDPIIYGVGKHSP